MTSSDQFSSLTQEDQIARLQKLGEAALAEFGVDPSSIEPLVHAENTTFKVTSPQGVFNLRISRPGYQSTSNIRSEILFLSALRLAGFRVPKPWQERLVTASDPLVPEPRDVVLLGWMDGEFARGQLTVERAQRIGRFMARMHEFSISWELPEGFDRQSLHAWAFNPRVPMPFDEPTPLAFEEDRLLLIEEDHATRGLLASLPREADWFGLIHSDLHLGNVLFEGDELNVIDFDDTGFGFWLYDFAAALCYSVGAENYLELQEAMQCGYAQIRELPPQTRELLSPFLRLRAAGIANWVLGRPDNPWFRENGAGFVHKLCDRIRAVRAFGE